MRYVQKMLVTPTVTALYGTFCLRALFHSMNCIYTPLHFSTYTKIKHNVLFALCIWGSGIRDMVVKAEDPA